MTSAGSPLTWALFALLVTVVLGIDLGVLRRNAREVSMKEAAVWVVVWMVLGLLFNGFVFMQYGGERGMQFTQAWLLEYALSVDNVFVFIVIFGYFKVPESYQHRVLFWGILGAVVTRGVFVVAGAALVSRFHWVMYLLGAFLVVTSVKLMLQKEEHLDPSQNPVLKLFRRVVPSTDSYEGARFFATNGGRRVATPLLAVLVVVEATDVAFAVDSIPACFGVTTDVFIVYTSNIFAILGLRSLFFVVSGLMAALRFLKVGVALILAFIGAKILLDDRVHIPVSASLGILAGILALAIVVSLLFPERRAPQSNDH